MVPSGPHVAPRATAPIGEAMVTGAPPAMATFLIVGTFEKSDPLSVRREERVVWQAETAQHCGLELVERSHQQLAIAAIDDA